MAVSCPRTGFSINIEGGALDRDVAFVSHAHADHVHFLERIPPKKEAPIVLASVETRKLIATRFPSIAKKIAFHDDATNLFSPNAGYTTHLVPCGHVLGSRSLVISRSRPHNPSQLNGNNHEEVVFLYTGDFCTQPGRLLPPLAPVKAEILACECTFGMPFFEFPPFEVLAGEITDWIATALHKGPVVLYGYSLGKNQELLSLLEPFSADTTIIADEETCEIADVYRSAGIPLPGCEPYKKYSRGKFLEKNSRWILLLSPSGRFEDRYQKLDRTGCRRAMFSGWAMDGRWLEDWRVDAGFPLSDHPSFPDLISFIEECAPATVLLMHGNGTILRKKLLERSAGSVKGCLARDTRLIALK
jgi:Cft2 family RNA processing exonuclease